MYDNANRLTSVDGVTYTYDANGNLLSDGVNTYTYNYANRMATYTDGVSNYAYTYNGRGDRLQQTVNGVTTTYTLDLNAGLPQILEDGSAMYLYGNGRVGEYSGTWAYYTTDALGSVRQIVGPTGLVQYYQSYEPYGDVLASAGQGGSNYGYAAEWTDAYIKLIYLRSRYYAPTTGRFLTKDFWGGNYFDPLSLNRWAYVQGQSGRVSRRLISLECRAVGMNHFPLSSGNA